MTNQNLIKEGDSIISDYISSEFDKKYSRDVTQALHDYLTSEQMLSHVALHMGIKDIVLTSVINLIKFNMG